MRVVKLKKIKLFCLPYAGGSAASYFRWRKTINPYIEIIPVELSGRGQRIGTPLYRNFEEALEDVYSQVISQINHDEEYIIFGHSMGSLIAFELGFELLDHGYSKLMHMFFSGSKSPDLESEKNNYYNMPDSVFLECLVSYGGMSDEILFDEQLMKFFLPILRSDFNVVETYKFRRRGRKLPCDITVLSGEQDIHVKKSELVGWGKHTNERCCMYQFKGGHFFVNDNMNDVINLVNRIIK